MSEEKLPFDDITFPYGITYEMIDRLIVLTNREPFECQDTLLFTKGDFEKAKGLLMPNDSCRIIGFYDFVVKTDIYKCKNKGHNIEEITAVIYCLLASGDIIEKNVMAGYCLECDVYYILNKEFENLKNDCQLLCRVIDNSIPNVKGVGYYSQLKETSVLKQYGYNTNQIEGLTKVQRQTILEFILCSKILSKTEICAHLDWLIESRSYDTEKFSCAIDKWKMDRKFIEEYKITNERKIVVKNITKGKCP